MKKIWRMIASAPPVGYIAAAEYVRRTSLCEPTGSLTKLKPPVDYQSDRLGSRACYRPTAWTTNPRQSLGPARLFLFAHYCFEQFPDRPSVVGKSMRLRRTSALQAAVLPAEVVVGEHEAQGCPMVAPSLGEAIGQSAHPFAEVPDRAVHAFCVRSTDLGVFRFAQDYGLLVAYYPRRRILAAVLFGRLCEYLDDRSVINPTAHESAYPVRIRCPAVGRKVKLARSGVGQFHTELSGVHVAASAHVPSQQQLGVSLNRSEAIAVTHPARNLLADGGGVFAVNVLPKFVGLNVDNADALNYNYCRKHRTLGKITPAQAHGLETNAWTVRELILNVMGSAI
jgi:hypothetical protein